MLDLKTPQTDERATSGSQANNKFYYHLTQIKAYVDPGKLNQISPLDLDIN